MAFEIRDYNKILDSINVVLANEGMVELHIEPKSDGKQLVCVEKMTTRKLKSSEKIK